MRLGFGGRNAVTNGGTPLFVAQLRKQLPTEKFEGSLPSKHPRVREGSIEVFDLSQPAVSA